jgi:NADH-quinone oxidoreductase subunit G
MPKITIDSQEIEVAEGTKIITAAEQLGIMIPRFCYHPALGSVGACRVCAVKIDNGGRLSGIQMSCMIDALDGMVVSTEDPEAVAFRRQVIEWLMINHPHDCPVCDEGGHCLLQDLTVSGGHGIRRFKGAKRTYTDQYLGPLVQHEMNRCIQCYRCSRFYQEYCGYRDLGVLGIAGRTYFGRHRDGVLESPFSGNLIDICPTGVFTDKPSRYTGRRWDFERSPGICIHCSLGCHTTVSARYRRVVRQEARYSGAVNGHFICDRGRYGFYYADQPDRPRKGRVRGEAASPAEAAFAAMKELDAVTAAHGASAVAVVGSTRSSLETQFALKQLCREKGWQPPVFFMDSRESQAVRMAASCVQTDTAVSMKEIEAADCILTVGTDVLAEAPMAALAIRQAKQGGAFVAAMDYRPLEWPFDFLQLPLSPSEMHAVLEWLKSAVAGKEPETGSLPPGVADASQRLPAVVSALSRSSRPVIVCGTDLVDARVVEGASELSILLQSEDRKSGFFPVLEGANTYGAALLDEAGKSLEHLMDWIDAGGVRALVCVESDILHRYADKPRLENALSQLALLVALDSIPSEEAAKAHAFAPVQTVFEAGGIYINQEGRAQQACPAHAGGLPVLLAGGGGHPPRVFAPGIPGGDVRAAWQLIMQWREAAESEAGLVLMAEMLEAYPELSDMPAEGVGVRPAGRPAPELERKDPGASADAGGGFQLLSVPVGFGGESLSRYSQCLRELEPEPVLGVCKTDAERLGLTDGDSAEVSLKYQGIALPVRTSGTIPSGLLLLPRLPSLFWQQLDAGGAARIGRNQITASGK